MIIQVFDSEGNSFCCHLQLKWRQPAMEERVKGRIYGEI